VLRLCRPQVRWAAENGIGLTTADTPAELAKLARWHPRTAVLLRIRADDPSARCCLARRAAHPPRPRGPALLLPGILRV
jgi:ornithine decarboxylase